MEITDKMDAWIVWSTNTAGLVTMEVIALTNRQARDYKDFLEHEKSRNYVRVHIERTQVNHLLATDMDELWQEMYGGVKAAQERVIQQRIELLKRAIEQCRLESSQAWGLLKSAQGRIRELEAVLTDPGEKE